MTGPVPCIAPVVWRVHRTRRRQLFLLSLLLAWLTSSCHAAASPSFLNGDAIESYVQAQMQAWNIPGAALAIVQNGQVIHLRGFGQADSSGRPVSPQTPFEIGSCSKSFTALAILQLVEQDKVGLDAPVQRYLPWFQLADPGASAEITIRHLLNHSTGLPQSATWRIMVNPSGLGLEDQVRALKNQATTSQPGAVYEYSNLNYLTLALVIESVGNQSYADYVRQNIFAPLEMSDSFAEETEARMHGMSDGRTWWFGAPLKSLEAPRPDMLGAGSIMVSAEDMSHYLIAQLNGGRYANARVLSTQGVELMHQPTLLKDAKSDYGMGWVTFAEKGVHYINHNGQSAGVTCSMILAPERNVGVAVLANVSGLLPPHAAWSLASRVKDMFLTGQPATVDSAYRDFYLPWDGGFLLAGALVTMSVIADVRRKDKGTKPSFLSVFGSGLFALAFLLGLPLGLGYDRWRGMFVWQPDAVYGCLVLGGILLLQTAIRLYWRERSK